MWYTAALILSAALLLSAAWDKRKSLVKGISYGLLGVAIMMWAAYRIATDNHPVTYPSPNASEISFIPVSQWGFTQYAAIAIAALMGVIAIRAYHYFVNRG